MPKCNLCNDDTCDTDLLKNIVLREENNNFTFSVDYNLDVTLPLNQERAFDLYVMLV